MKPFALSLALIFCSCGSGGTPAPVTPHPVTLAASPPVTFWTGTCEVRLVNYADVAVVSYAPVGPVPVGYHAVEVHFADGSVVTGTLLFAAPVVTVWVVP